MGQRTIRVQYTDHPTTCPLYTELLLQRHLLNYHLVKFLFKKPSAGAESRVWYNFVASASAESMV